MCQLMVGGGSEGRGVLDGSKFSAKGIRKTRIP